jgi:Ca-activated chloride channel family protein
MGPTIASQEVGGGVGDGSRGTSQIRDVMPHVLPDVFEGEQIVVAGRYRGTAPMVVRIAGTVRGEARTWDVPLDPSAASTRHGFVPRIWATRRIAYLTEQVRQLGAEPGVTEADPRVKELTGEVVGLSVRWGVLSEYTAFLARENVQLANTGEVVRETTDNFGRLALRQRAGAGGAAQQADYAGKAVAGGVEAAAAAPAWRNIRNEVESTDAVLNVANQSYFRRGAQWIDSRLVSIETLTPTRRVEFGSQEYLDLAQRLARDGEQGILAQAGELVLMVDNDVVLVLPPA